MKLRLRSNTVRLRLMRSEVDELAEKGTVSEIVRLGRAPEMSLVYRVSTGEEEGIGFEYSQGMLTVRLPIDEVREWAVNDRVGFTGLIDVSQGEPLKVTVEKDFKCLTERVEDEGSDAYPHPDAARGHAR